MITAGNAAKSLTSTASAKAQGQGEVVVVLNRSKVLHKSLKTSITMVC